MYKPYLLRQLMMRGIVGSMDGWWRWVRVMQRCYGTTSWRWISSRSSAEQRANHTRMTRVTRMTRMRRMSSGIMIVVVRDLNKTIFLLGDNTMQFQK